MQRISCPNFAIDCHTRRCEAANVQISTEAMCLGVLFDIALVFAPHIRRVSSKCFYHLRQMKTVRLSLAENAAKTMVYIPSLLVGSRVDYCNSILHRVSVVLVQPLQNTQRRGTDHTAQAEVRPHTADPRNQLHRLRVQQRTEYKIVCAGLQVST